MLFFFLFNNYLSVKFNYYRCPVGFSYQFFVRFCGLLLDRILVSQYRKIRI